MAETFEDLRPLLFSIAYRMLGSVARGRGRRPGGVPALPARARERHARSSRRRRYLSTVTTRLAIDHLRSARVRRETYIGEWLPEPLLTDASGPDARRHARTPTRCRWRSCCCSNGSPRSSGRCSCCTTSSTTATTRSPSIVGKSEDNCRQLAVRARRHVDERPAALRGVARDSASELAARFFDAVGEGDMDGLVELLAADVVVYGDGGGTQPVVAATRSTGATRSSG